MANLARRVVTGLALVGVAYALRQREASRSSTRVDEQIDHLKEQFGERLARLQADYGPALRNMAVAAGFMPGLRFRWRVLAAALPKIANSLQRAMEPETSAIGRGMRAAGRRR
jgi:hypothetical protein